MDEGVSAGVKLLGYRALHSLSLTRRRADGRLQRVDHYLRLLECLSEGVSWVLGCAVTHRTVPVRAAWLLRGLLQVIPSVL